MVSLRPVDDFDGFASVACNKEKIVIEACVEVMASFLFASPKRVTPFICRVTLSMVKE